MFEVLIVIALIAMIATGVAFAALDQWEKAKRKDALKNAQIVRAAIKTFWMDNDAECPDVERLISEQILDDGSPRTDPWGSAWRIDCEDRKVAVSSNGRDRKPGTDDDLRSPPAAAVAKAEAP